jgi:AcrR family transcriptional regulator
MAQEGIGVPVHRIAQKAGLGVGTLYRHFPTKEILFQAILIEDLSALTVDAQGMANAADPGAAFFGFLGRVGEVGAAKRDLLVAIMDGGMLFDEAGAAVKDALRDAVEVLLQRAQSVDAVRSDVTADSVMSLIGATCEVAAYGPTGPPADLLAIVCDGLRPRRQLDHQRGA